MGEATVTVMVNVQLNVENYALNIAWKHKYALRETCV